MESLARTVLIAIGIVAGGIRPAGAAIAPPARLSIHDESLNWRFYELEVDSRGQLWFVATERATGNWWMTRFLPDGTLLGSFPLPVWPQGCQGLAIAPDHTAYVAEGNGRVTRFTESGEVVATFTLPGSPGDLEMAHDGTLVASTIESPARVLYRVTSEGSLLARWEVPVLHPWAVSSVPIAVAPDGSVLAGCLPEFPTLEWPSTVLVLNADLQLRTFWRTQALDLDRIEVDGGGNVYVFDEDGGQGYCYTKAGSFLTYVSLDAPAIAVSRDGRIHWADWVGFFGTFSSAVKSCVVTLDDLDGGYRVDGTVYREPMAFDWPSGTVHRVEPLVRSRPADGVRVDWLGWDDGTRDVREVTADDAPTTLEVRTERSYRVDMKAVGGGRVSPASDWFLSGTELTLTAVPDEGFGLTGWTAEVGDLEPGQPGDPPAYWDRPDLTATIQVRGPVAQEATFQRFGFELTVSASDVDPFVNAAPPANDPRKLYLWATCLERGMSALEADAAGSLERSPFIPATGTLSVYDEDPDRLLLAVGGCPTGAAVNRLLGYWWVYDDGGDLCLAPSADNGRLGATDCVSSGISFWPMQVTGFSSSGPPCVVDGSACATPRDRLLTGAATLEVGSAGDEAVAAPGAIAFAEPRPNPFRGRTRLAFTVAAPQPVGLVLYDVRGRRVRSYAPHGYAAGAHAIEWDGRDGDGRAVPAGIYFVRFDGPQQDAVRKIVYLGR